MKKPYKFIWFIQLLFLCISLSANAQTPPDEICYNGIDDDRDGLTDCQDSDCSFLPFCRIEGDDGTGNVINCNDGIDNDNDGLTDCQEPACAANTTICPVENDCSNGIDDDGDGFIDYYDGDCLGDPSNPNDYIVTQPDCEAVPVGNVFEIEPAWDSDIRTSAAMGMPSVADLDQDGVPEVITINTQNGWMYILDGRDGNILDQERIQNGGVFAYPAVADVDGDGRGEIFTISHNGVIRVYEDDLSLKWSETSVFTRHGRQLGLTDFNADGRADLYYGNEIRDAQTGQLLIAGSHGTTMYPSANHWQNELNGVPVAVDILPSAGLELVVGHIIYEVNITNTGGTAGNTMTEAQNMDDAANLPTGYLGYHPADADWGGQTYSNTAVVDYNQDGSLDVIIGGANGHHDGPTTAFFWDLANDEVRMFFVTRPGNTIPGCPNNNICGNFRDMDGNKCNSGEDCYWMRGMGNINVADIDDDGQVEATFMSGSSLFALETDFTLKWANHEDFWESSSGFTGTTVFDFDGDGSSEIVYRDEINLYIVDGFTGEPLNLLNGTFCSSQTQADYPIVADVDGDGETEIIVSCGEVENTFGDGPATSATRERGFIRAYKAAGNNFWVPSRALWNQSNYFNVNINDNLTVPRVQQAHHLSFSQICNDPNIIPPFALNKFLNQSPRISFCGQLAFPAPKLDFVDDGVVIDPPVCPDNQFDVRLSFQNNGDLPVNSSIPISFYADDPAATYGNADQSPYLETISLTIPGGLQIGQRVDTTVSVNGDRGVFELYVSLNDRGQYDSLGAPVTNEDFYPLTELNGTVRECDQLPTILSKEVIPLPFDIQAVVIRDNRNCPGASANNGEVQVFAADSTAFPGSSYGFTWTDIHTGQVVGTDALVIGLDSGTYRVEVVNTDYGCTGNADTVTIQRFEEWPDTKVVTVEEIQPVSGCTPGTADGIAHVLLNGSPVDETNYDIEWEDEQQPGVLAVGDTASNLQPILYKVTIINKLTGCTESQTIDMTLDLPDLAAPTVTSNTNCKNPNGSITARLNSGNKSDYEYILIQHSPTQDTLRVHNNGEFTGLDEGVYELKAFNPTTFCGLFSNGIMVDVTTSSSIDNIPIQVAQEQSSCEPPYNGQLSAVLSNPNNYDWVWYRGTVTIGPSADTVATDYITPDTLGTNLTDIYTVVAIDQSTGCSFTDQIQLTENIILPDADATAFTVTHQTTCSPNGSIQAAVGNPELGADYEYRLLQGSSELQSNTTGLFENLAAGPYVVVIENTVTNCISLPSGIVEVEDQITPFGSVSINDTPVTNCNPVNPNGALLINVADGNANYSFKWFIGIDTANAVSPQPATTYHLTDIAAGDYMLSILNLNTGCDTLLNITLDDASADYQDGLTATVTHNQEYCFPNVYSGEIQADLIQSTSGETPDASDYTFFWYEGRQTDVRNGTASLISGQNSATISGLNVGWYSVRAVKNDGSACHALDTAEVRIEDVRDFPITNVNITVVEQSSCNSNNPNGSLVGDVGGNTSDYTFTWYQLIGGIRTNINVNNPTAIISGNNVENIGVGTYVLIAENMSTGCTGEAQVYLRDNIIKGSEIRLNLASENATQCTPPNGVAEVASIDLSEDDGATFSLTDALSNYSYRWFYGKDTTTAIDPATNATSTSARLENVEPGMYTVLATNINSQCTSVTYSVEVSSDVQDQLDFDFLPTVQSATGCVNPDGSLEVIDITGGTGPFTYQWYKGSDDTYPLTGETSSSLTNIRADKYMVRISDQTTGCYKDSVYTLPPNAAITPVPPAVLSTVDHVTTCDPGNWDGRLIAEVDSTVLTLPNFTGYDTTQHFFYYWFRGENVSYINPNVSPIDTISNLKVINNDPPSIGDIKDEVTDLEPGFYTVIVVDAYDHVVSGGTAPLGCRSDPKTFEVKAIAQSPEVAFTTQNDTYCVGDNGEASVTIAKRAGDSTSFAGYSIVDATKDNASYTHPVANTQLTLNNGSDQTEIILEELDAGNYTFTFQDNSTMCDTTIALDIADLSVAPVLAFDNVRVNSHQTSCNPHNGEAEVIVSASATGIIDLSDYQFYWHNSEVATSAEITDNTVYFQTGTIASGLVAGEYFVYAVNTVTGCNSSFQSVEIEERVPATIIQIVGSSPDTNCDPAVGSGSISVEINDEDFAGNTVYPTGGYTITWKDATGVDISSQATTNGGTQPATSLLPDLNEGVYTITVVNNDTQCGSTIARDSIRLSPLNISFTTASISTTLNTTCDGNGAAEITEVRKGSTVFTLSDPAFADFIFEWRASDDVTVLSGTGPSQTNLQTGTYFVYATDIFGCDTARLMLNIDEDISTPFIFQQELTDFISCTGVNEGVIEVFGGESDPSANPALGYSFTWTMADGSPMPAYASYNADASRVSNLTAGEYRVEMTNLNTGCVAVANYTVETRSVLPILFASKLNDQSFCFGNGAAQIDDVTLMKASVNLSDYRFFWYENDPTSTALTAPQYGISTDSLSADGLVAGNYFVVGENRSSGCRTLPVQVIIDDTSEPLVILLNDISEPITGCNPANFPNGDIEIEVRDGDNVITRWYEGYTITDPADSISGFNNSLEINNLVPGGYTVWVMDTLTGCNTTRSYTIEGIEVPIMVNTSSNSFSSCIQPDGGVVANVNGGSGDYIFTWFVEDESGTTQLDVPDDANYVEGLVSGTYSVVVRDRVENYCEDNRSEIVVEDSRGEEIMLTVNTDFQMTNCDDGMSNGQLSAEVNGELSRYNFFWYQGLGSKGQPITSGPIATNLPPGNYTVIARDRVSGCISNEFYGSILSEPDTTTIPIPFMSTTPVTRCDAPNGTATASLDSTLINPDVDYMFTWFDEEGEEIFSSSRHNDINFLSTGNYSVMVTNSLTGCVSRTAGFSIGEEIYTPEFELLSTPSTCLEENGTIMIDFVEPMRVVDIEWLTPNGYTSGFFLSNQPPGYFEVNVTDDKGCLHTKTGVIMSNIHAYNGVSPNGDGRNDRFIISCIQQYDDNVVKIFNRAGALVYENENYDNETVYFEGVGNRGLYIGGEKLPEGTYYYIIDKNNGEEPESGFLELLR